MQAYEHPDDHVSLCKTTRTTKPYILEYLTYYFFKLYSKILFCKSIRPGNKKRYQVVTDMKALRYEPKKTISYKLRFTKQNWSDIPLLRNFKQEKVTFDMLPQLYMNRIKIKK